MRRNEAIDWIGRLEKLPDSRCPIPTVRHWRDVYHLIVVPMYKEPLEIMRDTFRALEKADYPKDRMIVVLGCEEKVKEAVEITINWARKNSIWPLTYGLA